MALEAHECQLPEENVPTYQYACTACGHQLEAVQSFTDASLTECPECQGKLRKLFSAVGVVFKGSGFYRTDSRDGSANGAGNGKSGEANKSGEPKSKSGEAKSSSDSSGSSSSSEAKSSTKSSPANTAA
ncbi:FmdB family zinc ribbon protein [Rhizomonospora bruguierae]|uniref:FmdB family zinc ribbon protein n=1 Tax=Rhizomonospora bruguierae TaxID=1581705 RepID=UPI0020BF8E46|nr:FmdB family zinc ribbon protein [Micromonospora sp. NBRC 107566]